MLTYLKERIHIPIALLIGSAVWWKFVHHTTPEVVSVTAATPLAKPRFAMTKDDRSDFVRESVQDCIGYGSDSTLENRTLRVKELPADLSAAELESLLLALMEPRPSNVTDGLYAHFFHELCNKLHHFRSIRGNYASTLYMIASDQKRDEVIRDYAQQHLRRIWEKSDDLAELRSSIEASFWKLTEQEPAVAASALLSLHTLGAKPSPRPNFSDGAIANVQFIPRLQTIFQQTPAPSSVSLRMTAARIAGERQLAELSPSLKNIVQNESEHTLVRISSINSLRLLGKSDDLHALASLYQHDSRFTAAFRHALP